MYDYQKFPERVVAGSPEPFTFTLAINEQDVQARFEASPLVEGDLDQFLTDTGTQAFLVIQDDHLLYEKYYNGAERDTIVTSFSVSKSFASALVGIAIGEGFIDSVDDPIAKYLPELAAGDPAFQ